MEPPCLLEPGVCDCLLERIRAQRAATGLQWDRLTRRQRWVVELVIMDGMTWQQAAAEIADRTGGAPLSRWTIRRERLAAVRLLLGP